MSVPAITVAMSVYNNAAWLREAVDSILAQTFADFEFVIVDDGSSDGSGAILDDYAARDPRVRVIHQENRGLVASLNRIVAEARAPLLARMDGDDIALPQRFERQVAFFAARPDYGVVGTSTHDMDEEGRVIEATDFHPLDHETFVASLDRGTLLCHSSVMMRTAELRAVGGYRAAFRHCEDYDLWLRLCERTKLCSIRDRLLLYRRSAGQVSSAHAFEQRIGAAIARAAHDERAAGRPDPTEGLTRLPPLEELDEVFGREGVARQVRERAALGLLYSKAAMRDGAFDMLIGHIREAGAPPGQWRTVARLLKWRDPVRAARLAVALASN